jgi:hypothetical protein
MKKNIYLFIFIIAIFFALPKYVGAVDTSSIAQSGGNVTAAYISVNKSGTISCDQIKNITDFFNDIYLILEIIAVVALVILTMVDFAKAVISDSEKANKDMKKAQKRFATRIAITTILILLPIIVNIIINAIGASTCYIG